MHTAGGFEDSLLLSENVDPRSVTLVDVRAFLADFQEGQSAKTVREAQLALRRFFRFLVREGKIRRPPSSSRCKPDHLGPGASHFLRSAGPPAPSAPGAVHQLRRAVELATLALAGLAVPRVLQPAVY